MADVAIDSSVAKWVLPEADTAQAQANLVSKVQSGDGGRTVGQRGQCRFPSNPLASRLASCRSLRPTNDALPPPLPPRNLAAHGDGVACAVLWGCTTPRCINVCESL
jgi:hypothetical protein